MIRSVSLKFIAFVLAACFLVSACASLIGVAAIGQAGLYDYTPQEVLHGRWKSDALNIGRICVRAYASEALGGCSEEMIHAALGDPADLARGNWNVQIFDGNQPLEEYHGASEYTCEFELDIDTFYYQPAAEGSTGDVSSFAITAEDGRSEMFYLVKCESPVYKVIIQLSPSYCEDGEWEMMEQLYGGRYWLIAMAVVSLLLFAAFFVYLCCVAGRSPKSSVVRASGLNRLPLDFYTALLTVLGGLVTEIGIRLLDWSYNGSVQNSTLIIAASGTTALSLLVLAFFFALAAQLKTKDGFWWKNLLIVRIFRLLGKCIRWCFRGSVHILSLLPVLWQWLLVTAVPCGIMTLILCEATRYDDDYLIPLLLVLVVFLVLVCYGGYAFGLLLRGAQKMSKGDLTHTVNTRFLVGSFRDFALRLNALSEAAMLAAEKQVRAERMKTELITNVSHDIKTPLTSIISYVDLLGKPHSEQEQAQYLEVLSRQSLRLKRLIEDLMELSKASSGNLPVELEVLDAAEVVKQALGEFSEKLNRANLIPIFDAPEEPLTIMADGRLAWRVLSNLLSNAVKYAMTGTRVYIDLTASGQQVLLSVKNISAQQLGVTADELLERFVRGDSARNTEGSGLGLNIAKSLMEIQGGQLKLMLDGDLFKVTLVFPTAAEK